ncbi:MULTISPECIES: squalene--hopene cyclase [Sphingomonas]|uniref:squalene--hopene cyclase n=1 Tax=Sphingomonas TaxID=13687 RepID=UPI0009E82FFC|nr:squalene--hopene cyclase [Sphingomonas sp. CCH10-B3]
MLTVAETRPDLIAAADAATARAAAALRDVQRDDGHWVFELEADCTIPAEYVLLRHYLGEPVDAGLEAKIGRYLRRIQSEKHDGWSLFHAGAFDISASVKAYFALKMIGDDIDAPHMARARAAIHKAGGAAAVNVFTRIQLALFDAGPWSVIPTMPAELILLPRWFPVHLSKMSYWARTVIVPLLVLGVMKPVAKNPRGIKVDELYTVKAAPLKSNVAGAKRHWQLFFGAIDRVLKTVEPVWPKGSRERAIKACVDFVVERLNGEDGLGAIYPAMANSVMMFDCLGYPENHPHRAIARASVEKLLVIKDDEAYCQPCVSPVWDTALAAHAMLEVGGEENEARARAGLEWLKPLQVLDLKGDWADDKPEVRPGGWAFQYRNDHYPDLDDTAVVVMAFDRAKDKLAPAGVGADGYDEAIDRGIEWTVGLQSKNGGWGAFDADNTYDYLNNIPFADHGALLDPPTADVTARCISMLAQRGEPLDSPRMQAAIQYLAKEQMADGSWFGRWGVNYIYGTWSVLCALNAAGLGADHPSIARAADWLEEIQNPDGGWGEDCDSYKLDYAGYEPAPSTASQTAWALLALMAAGRVDGEAVDRGIAWLVEHQDEDGLWGQEHYTGGGFPRVFYLRYHGYPKYFPLWAVARYRNLKRSNARDVAWGM